MWINKEEYKKLLDEKQSLEESMNHTRIIVRELIERNSRLINENIRLKKEIDQLKVKYADEVEKNYKLASYLSENKKD